MDAREPNPPEFLWGVATSAYQTEGGYNGAGQPQTNWAFAEQRNDVAPAGAAAEFWTRYAEDFERCARLGLNAFRFGIEWSRVQPTVNAEHSAPPPFDYAALDRYADMLTECRHCGLEPIVTLHHFVHPAWLGADPWLKPETPELFVNFVREAIGYINRRLVELHEVEPIRYYLTINEPNMLVLNTYVAHLFPTRARAGLKTMRAAFAQLFRAHVLAYNCIHDLHEGQRWPAPFVSLNNYCSDVYWTDKAWLDLLAMREHGVRRERALPHIHAKAREFYDALKASGLPLRRRRAVFGGLMKRISDYFGARSITPESIAPLLDAIDESPRARLLDYIAIDYYDPFAANAFRLPIWWDHELKNKSVRSWLMNSVTSKWWDWRVLPRGLRFFCEQYYAEFGLPLVIAENGMALRRKRGDHRVHRRDRMTRSQFIELHLAEVEHIRRRGIPLIGYLHWSLFDNYEWGTYTPRFGLYSIDFDEGTDRRAKDHLGDEPSETYARLVAASRAAHEPFSSQAA